MVVLLGAGSLAVARSLHTSPHASAHAPAKAANITTVTRNEAAAWVAQQVSRNTVVSCDRVMCLALREHGVPPSDLLVLLPKTVTPAGSQIVVATATIRDQFGRRLASVYAPAVLASFGSGNARIEIRQIAPNGAAAYQSALNADLQDRKKFESLLVGNYLQVVAAPRASQQLHDGQVDMRLVLLIEGLAANEAQPIDIVALGDLGPGASAGIPLRSATLAGSMATLRSMLEVARSKKLLGGPYTPTHAEITQRGGRQVLVLEFAAPSPLGVLSSSTP
jgi:hypothetical protein